ncbi:hypothetical protein [uncultured Methanobrevibacter sp.]|uniref:hypothetical protein n=1 Tax=uncultured Methanobrevibacter sp. TaxID=253161 RepID=UPI0025CD19C2|nr:hypothetical protein [uncultured Methanobrevibacter sp.]
MVNHFIQLNDAIRLLHDDLKKFERKFWETENGEPGMINIWVKSLPAFHDYNFYLEVEIMGENSWTSKWHDLFCKTFECKLDYIKKQSLKTENNYGDGFQEKWIYTYKPASWVDFHDLRYDDMGVVEFKRSCSMETVRLNLTINNDFTDSICVSSSFYDALKENSPNNTSLTVTEKVYEKLVEAVRNDRETGFIQFVSIGDRIRFKKWKR